MSGIFYVIVTSFSKIPTSLLTIDIKLLEGSSLLISKFLSVSEKPVYACELCPAKCGRKTDLRIHVQKLHTSDKPLKCKRCGKSFPDRYSCKIHNKVCV